MTMLALFESVLLLVGLILLGVLLRVRGLLSDAHAPVLARLVTQVTLPALLFSALVRAPLEAVYSELAAIMFGAELISLGLGWGLARLLRLGPAQAAAVILTAGFGSSSLLGYPLIAEVFSDDAAALSEAAMISELGVGPALFTLGTLIAAYLGAKAARVSGITDQAAGSVTTAQHSPGRAALAFFYSPIFMALCLGTLWSFAGISPEGPVVGTALRAIDLIAAANSFLVALSVGLAIRFQGLRAILWVALGVGLIKLVLKPILVWLPSLALPLSVMQLEVLIIEAAMPSALLAVVLARRYGCDAELASQLVLATSLGCLFSMLLMTPVLGLS